MFRILFRNGRGWSVDSVANGTRPFPRPAGALERPGARVGARPVRVVAADQRQAASGFRCGGGRHSPNQALMSPPVR